MIEPTERTETTSPSPAGATPSSPPPNQDESGGVVRAAAVLAIGNVASRVLGMAREAVKANLFGASGLLSAFEIAAYVPTTLFDLIIGGMVNSSLVPVFSDYAAKEHQRELWGVLSTVLSVATVLLLLVVGIVELFAPQVAWLLGAYNLEDTALTGVSIRLLRLSTPAVLFLSISSILTGVLYALKRFALPAFMAAIFNGTIVVVALLRPEHIDSLIWGMLLGALLQVVLQLPALRDAHLRWRLDWRHPAIRRILRLYAPIVAGLVVNQAGIAIGINLATRTGDASLTYMRYATTLYQFPLGLVVTALSIATLPTLSRQAGGQLAAFKQTLAQGVRLVLALILPATAGLLALATPIVALIFQHGQFLPQDTATTALVLRIFLFGLPFAAVDQMLIFASYARKDTLRPALVGVVSIVIYVAVAGTLLAPLGLLSLMIADAVKHVVHASLMLVVLHRQIGSLAGYELLPSTAKSLVAATVTGGVAYLVAGWIGTSVPLSTTLNKLAVVVPAGVVGVGLYLGLARLLNIKEIRRLRHLLRRS